MTCKKEGARVLIEKKVQLVDTQSFFIHRYKTVGQCITCILVRLNQVIQMIWKKPFFFKIN